MMKSLFLLGAMALTCAPASAATLLSDGTYATANDLTRISDGGLTLEFLDLTSTQGVTAANAVASYAGAGFALATYAQVTDLLSAFGFTVPALPASGTAYLSGGDSTLFNSKFGNLFPTGFTGTAGNFDNGTGGIALLCIAISGCGSNKVVNPSHQDGSTSAGVMLVRVSAVPLPATGLLLFTGFGALAAARRRKRRSATA